MSTLTHIVNLLFSPRRRAIDRFRAHPLEVQEEQLKYLLKTASATRFGQAHGFADIHNAESFRQRVELHDYESFAGFIDRSRKGESDVLWPGRVNWFAKSSGTTDAKSKYIPVTRNGLTHCHMRGPIDVAALYASLHPDSKVFGGKTLTLGGSRRIEREGEHALTGDLSAILIENTPAWASSRRIPSVETALIPDFEEKVRRIAEECASQHVTSFAGVPSWNLVMLRHLLEYSGKNNILEIWPDLELFIHGGVSFRPYREIYRQLIPSSEMNYMETYNASEGFFAIGDEPGRDDMLLMLDYHTYYEFLPLQSLHDPSKAIPLEGVRTGVQYALVISNSNGLWRYQIGDTVEFTSLTPYRIRITGRTKHYINAFGEELIVDNAERAMRAACDATGAEISEYTAAPIYMEANSKGAHEWIVEFSRKPESIEAFRDALDRNLQSLNSDYEAKRYKETTLQPPRITQVPSGTFLRWMEQQGKTGGQNKIPRLANDRRYADSILELTTAKPTEHVYSHSR